MSERADIVLKENEGQNPQAILHLIIEEVMTLCKTDSEYLEEVDWERAEQDEISHQSLGLLEKMANTLISVDEERQRLIAERDKNEAEVQLADKKAEFEHKEKMAELRLAGITEAVNSMIRLKEMGISVSMEMVDKVISSFLYKPRK